MIQADFDRFIALVSDVSAFYKQDFSPFAGRVWWQAMQPFDMDAVSEAFSKHCVNPDNGQFMPKPADIVKMLEGSTQDSGLVAWSTVDKAIRRVGTYRSVAFDDAIIHRVIVDMGGWIQLGTKTEDEWPFIRNEFVNRYRGYKMRKETPEYAPILIGVSEAHNSKEGFRIEPPTLIGNAEKAMQVLKMGSTAPTLQISSPTQFEAPRLRHAPKDYGDEISDAIMEMDE